MRACSRESVASSANDDSSGAVDARPKSTEFSLDSGIDGE